MSKKTSFNKKQKLILIIASVVVALVTVIAVGFNILTSSGVFLRSVTAAESEHFKVDNAMFSYFFYTEYIGEMEEYSEYYKSYYGFDESIPLKDQKYDEKTTWFEHFINMTKSRVMDMVLLAEAAIDNGYETTEEDIAYIDSEIENLKTSAMLEGVSANKYIQQTYGKGVKEKDIENALKIILLANKQHEYLNENMQMTEQEINEFFKTNSQGFAKCDIRKYTFNGENAKEYAERLAKAKNEEQFKQILGDILKEKNKLSEANIKSAVEKTLIEGYEYSAFSELDDWLFGGAKQYDTKNIYVSGEYTVYMVVKEAYTDEYVTKNIRHILVSSDKQGSMVKASAKAKQILAEFEETDKSEDSFKKLAMDYNDDANSYKSGGLYENILKEVYPEEFENWCFDAIRKPGDYEIIKTDSAYHIMYFVGDGLLSWQAQIKDELKNKKLNDIYNTYATQYKVQFYDNALKQIG